MDLSNKVSLCYCYSVSLLGATFILMQRITQMQRAQLAHLDLRLEVSCTWTADAEHRRKNELTDNSSWNTCAHGDLM